MCRNHVCPHFCCSPEGKRQKRIMQRLGGISVDKLRKLPEPWRVGPSHGGSVAERAAYAQTITDSNELAELLELPESARVRIALASAPGLTAEQQSQVAEDEDARVRLALAKNPVTDEDVLKALAGDTDAKVQAAAKADLEARAADCPEDAGTLRTLSAERIAELDAMDTVAKLALLRDENTAQVEIEHFFNDTDYIVRVNAAAQAAPGSLAPLANDRNLAVRKLVAKRTNDPAVLDAIASREHVNEDEKRLIVANPAVSLETLAKMAPGYWLAARELARRTPGGADALPVSQRPPEVRAEAARIGTLSPEEFNQLARDPERDVRHYLARRSDITPEAAAILSRDSDASVRSALAGNQQLDAQVRRELALSDASTDVRRSAIKADPSLRAALLESDDKVGHLTLATSDPTEEEARQVAVRTTSWEARLAAVRHLESAEALEDAWRATGLGEGTTTGLLARKKYSPAGAVVRAWKSLESWEQQEAAIRHRNDPDVMSLAAYARSNDVKYWAATSTATPVEDLQHLAGLRGDWIPERARETLAKLGEEAPARQEKVKPAAPPLANGLTMDDIKSARLVRTDWGWLEVVRVNAKSITVKSTLGPWNDRISFDKVQKVAA